MGDDEVISFSMNQRTLSYEYCIVAATVASHSENTGFRVAQFIYSGLKHPHTWWLLTTYLS